MMATYWWLAQIPTVANLTRTVIHGDVSYWTRPQARQAIDVAKQARLPIETMDGIKGVPRWVRWLPLAAESGGRLVRRAAAVGDDWINQRARYPGFLISIGVVLTGMFILPVPWIVLFPLDAVVGFAPRVFAAWLWLRNGRTRDFELRFTRPGIYQRPTTIRKLKEKAGVATHLLSIPGPGRTADPKQAGTRAPRVFRSPSLHLPPKPGGGPAKSRSSRPSMTL